MVAVYLIVFGACVFTALGIDKLQEKKRSFITNLFICICGICSVIVLIGSLILAFLFLEKREESINPPKYELIQEPLYKKVK